MLADRIAAHQLSEMAAQGAGIECHLHPGELSRLAPLLAAGAPGGLEVKIALSIGAESLPVLHIRLYGGLSLICQRCLGPVEWPVDIDVSLTAVADDAAAGNLASPFDIVVLDAEGALALRVAVEDEILATLPLSPRHASAELCSQPVGSGDTDCVQASRQVNRPFSGLTDLLQRDGQEDGKK